MCEDVFAAACQRHAVVSAVVDHEILHQYAVAVGIKAHPSVILDDGVGDACHLHVIFQHTLYLKAYEAISYDGMVYDMSVAFARLHEPYSVPLSRLVGIERLEAVALEYYGVLGSPVDDELSLAPSPQASASMEIYMGAWFYCEGAIGVDKCHIINDIRPLSGPVHVFQSVVGERVVIVGVMPVLVGEDAYSAYDIVGILPVCRQMYHVLVAVGVENQAVLDEERVVVVVRIYCDFDENIQAVVGINLLVGKQRSRLSVHVDAIWRVVALLESDGVDFEVLGVVVVYHQHPCRGAYAGEHRVESYGVGREADILRRVVGILNLLTA